VAEVVEPLEPSPSDPWVVHVGPGVIVRLFDANAGQDPDLGALVPSLAERPIVRMRQVHGADVARVTRDGPPEPPTADAMVTRDHGLSLVVRTADCVPLVLRDPHAGVSAVVHAGWRGITSDVIPATVAAMVGDGAQPERITAWVGPSICARCYPVGHQVQDLVAAQAPLARATSADGQPSVDVGLAARAQLKDVGVRDITADGRCTFEDPELFSARAGDAVARLQIVASIG
jgi:YfiH family protein